MGRDSVLDEVLELGGELLARPGVALQDDVGLGSEQAVLVRLRDHGRLDDARVRDQCRLDLDGRDVLAAHLHEVVAAPHVVV